MPSTSWKVECTGVPIGEYVSNGIRLATEDEAQRYGRETHSRWTGMGDWRVTECGDAVTHSADQYGRLEPTDG